jgi:hypothetical protein
VEANGGDYEPTLAAATEVKEKLFNPFRTYAAEVGRLSALMLKAMTASKANATSFKKGFAKVPGSGRKPNVRPQHRNLISDKNHNCNARRQIGGNDDVLDFLVRYFVDVDLTWQPAP